MRGRDSIICGKIVRFWWVSFNNALNGVVAVQKM